MQHSNGARRREKPGRAWHFFTEGARHEGGRGTRWPL